MNVAKILIREKNEQVETLIEGMGEAFIHEDFTILIEEGKTQSGKAGISFIMRDENGVGHVAQLTQGNFESLIGAFVGAVQRFNNKKNYP